MSGGLRERIPPQHIWLASWPRSGNTLLRVILHHCFGLRTTSVYKNDLEGNNYLEQATGHFEISAPPENVSEPWLVKTHELPPDNAPAIYIVRDGRAATASYCEFKRNQPKSFQNIPLWQAIAGYRPRITWSGHVQAWYPWQRPHTLLVRYEDMTADLPSVLSALAAFLKRPTVSAKLPNRSDLAARGWPWVRNPSDWRTAFTPYTMRLFARFNATMMTRLGYPIDAIPAAGLFHDAWLRVKALYWWLRWQLRMSARWQWITMSYRWLRKRWLRCCVQMIKAFGGKA